MPLFPLAAAGRTEERRFRKNQVDLKPLYSATILAPWNPSAAQKLLAQENFNFLEQQEYSDRVDELLDAY